MGKKSKKGGLYAGKKIKGKNKGKRRQYNAMESYGWQGGQYGSMEDYDGQGGQYGGMENYGQQGGQIKYDAEDMKKATKSLVMMVNCGALNWLKATFEGYPLEAVPNVWEGDEGMMEHVPKFPMPPLMSVPGDAESGSPVGSEGDLPEADPEDCGMFDEGNFFSLQEGKSKWQYKPDSDADRFWLRMAQLFRALETLSQAVYKAMCDLGSERHAVRKQACKHMIAYHRKLQTLKAELDAAEQEQATHEHPSIFIVMSLSEKRKFKRTHGLEGILPTTIRSIIKKYRDVKSKIRKVVHKRAEQLLPFKTIVSKTLSEVLSKKNEKDVPLMKLFGIPEENKNGSTEGVSENPVVDKDAEDDKMLLENDDDEDGVLGAGKPNTADDGDNNAAAKEKMRAEGTDRFWESVTALNRKINESISKLSSLDTGTATDSSDLNEDASSPFCRQLLLIKKKFIAQCSSLAKLREEMAHRNYDDRNILTAEDLAYLGADYLPPDSGLDVVNALLEKLKADFLKVQSEKHDFLEKCGFSQRLEAITFPKDNDVQLVRVCAHSRTNINLESFDRWKADLKRGREYVQETSGTPEDQQGAEAKAAAVGTDVDNGETATSHHDTAGTGSGEPVSGHDISVATEGTGAGPTEKDDESEMDDATDVSKSVNYMSFFMKNLGPDAFSVKESSPPVATEEFIEREKRHWDRLQKLLRSIDKSTKQLPVKSKMHRIGKAHAKILMVSIRDRIKAFIKTVEQERTNRSRYGYCNHVTYENDEYLPESSSKLLVKNLESVQALLERRLIHKYKATARDLDWSFMIDF